MAADEATLRKIFNDFDTDKSGSIDTKELKTVLSAYFDAVGEKYDEKRVNDAAAGIMKELDTSGDGIISIEEFVKAFK